MLVAMGSSVRPSASRAARAASRSRSTRPTVSTSVEASSVCSHPWPIGPAPTTMARSRRPSSGIVRKPVIYDSSEGRAASEHLTPRERADEDQFVWGGDVEELAVHLVLVDLNRVRHACGD